MNSRVTDEPAKARTDLHRRNDPPSKSHHPISVAAVRYAGAGLAAGSLSWAVAMFVFGSTGAGIGERVVDLTGLLFQLGVFGLLIVQMRTQAIGTSRFAAAALTVEAVLLGLASAWSLLHGVLPDDVKNAAWLMAFDLCWPVSMLGMALISVKLAAAKRWSGLLRWWPLVAESWAVVSIPSSVVFGEDVSAWIGGGHLLVGYATLGVLLMARPGHIAFVPSEEA
jgi:hypothetical protein